MRKIGVVCILMVACIWSFGQEHSNAIGEIHEDDLLESYGSESAASALFNRGKSVFRYDNGIYIEYSQETRIQIHSREGFNFAEVAIPFYQDGFGKEETIISIEGFSYNINEKGEIDRHPLTEDDIYEEDVYAGWKAKKFAFPHVREGSVIEYRYVKRTPFLKNPPDWAFQWEIPVKVSTYEIRLMPFYEYSYLLQGAARFDDYNTYESSETDEFAGIQFNYIVHRYTMNDLPPFKDESFITAKGDYITKLDFQLARIHYPSGAKKDIMSSWPQINDEYLEEPGFGRYLKQSEKLAKTILASNPALGESSNTVRAIVEFVRSEYKFNGSVRDMAIDKARDFIQKKAGGSAEINLFLCAMLRQAGIEANPVLLSTRDHGKVQTEYPFHHYFNDVVVKITSEDGMLLVDGTNALLAYDRLPIRCLNEVGLVISEEGERWVSLESNRSSMESYFVDMTLDSDEDRLEMHVMSRLNGYSGYAARKTVGANQDALKSSRLSLNLESISNIDFQNVSNPEEPFAVKFNGLRDVESYGNKVLIYPLEGVFRNENIFKADSRKYPVDMIYPKEVKVVSVIHLPQEYRAVELPNGISIDNDLLGALLSITPAQDQIRVTASLSFKSAVYPPSVYKQLRTQYAEIMAEFNQVIVLAADAEGR